MWRPRKWRHKVTPWCPHRCGPFFHITLHTVLELSWSTQPAINSKMLVSVTCCDQWFLIQATSHQWQYFALLLNVVKDVFQRSFQRDAVETWFPLKRYKRRAYVFGCSENYQEGNCEPGCLSLQAKTRSSSLCMQQLSCLLYLSQVSTTTSTD